MAEGRREEGCEERGCLGIFLDQFWKVLLRVKGFWFVCLFVREGREGNGDRDRVAGVVKEGGMIMIGIGIGIENGFGFGCEECG